VDGAARSAGALVATAALLLVGSLSRAALAHVSGAVFVVAVVGAAARVVDVGWPAVSTVVVATAVLAVAAVVTALPAGWRAGPRAGVLLVAGVAGAVDLARTLGAAARTAAAAMPVWHAAAGPTPQALDWQVPVALVLVAGAVALALTRNAWPHLAVAAAALVALAVPAAFVLPGWTPSLVDGLVAVPLLLAAARAGRGQDAVVRSAAAGVLVAHAVLVGLARPLATAVVLAALVALSTVVAMVARGGRVAVGTGAVAAGAIAVPGLGAAVAEVWPGTWYVWHAPVPLVAALGGVASVTGLLALLRRVDLPYRVAMASAGAFGGTAVTVAATVTGDGSGPAPFGVVAAVALLCVVGTVVLLGTDRPAAVPWLAVPTPFTGLAALVAVAPAVVVVLFGPYSWLERVWSGTPAGVGLVPPGGGSWRTGTAFDDGPAAVALLVLAAVVAVTAATIRPLWTAVRWTVPVLTLAALVGCAALRAPWPVTPAVSLASGLAMALLVALRPAGGPTSGVGVLVSWLSAGAGLAGSLPTRTTTLVALGATTVVATVAGVAGRALVARTAGWVVAVASGACLAFAAATAADLALPWAAYWVLLAAGVAFGLGTALARRALLDRGESRSFEAQVLEAGAHATAAVALLLTLGSVRHTAGVCTVWGLLLGLRALLPGARRAYAGAAAIAELVAYWLLLAASEVTLVEAYTVPAAGVAVLCGWLAARGQPGLRSWVAYGPALLAGFAPSLATIFVVPGEPLRRLAVGAAAVLVVVAGSVWRLQAPVVVGGLVVSAVAVHEIVLRWDLLPRWAPLAVAGLALVALATTYERRRRDLARLRRVVGGLR
jgi:hypothetical protein